MSMLLMSGCGCGLREDDRGIKELVSQMTLDEKISIISGVDQPMNFETVAVPRLGIPSVFMSDGPQGVSMTRGEDLHSTFYPCGIAVAASWDREAAREVGEGIGRDARARDIQIMLCPGVNIYRSPLCGRNFEYMGEDPYLAGETALQYITGVQSQGVMATIKHFALNNSEFDRHRISNNADERTLNEIYFPAFRKAVEGGVACVMTSYNMLDGQHAAENSSLIKDNLRAWGFEGIVMSDWHSTYSTIGCIKSGLDMEMPRPRGFRPDGIKPLLETGVVEEWEIDEKCMHILGCFDAYGLLDRDSADAPLPLRDPESDAAAMRMAIESPVLLKNDGVLPLEGGSVALAGPNADRLAFGGGSGKGNPYPESTTTLYSALSERDGYQVSLGGEAPTTVVCVGFDKDTESEGFDRTYQLPEGQDELILDAVARGVKVVVIINSGGEVDMSKWKDSVNAIIAAWYPGQAGGEAMARILTGEVSPSGRLPFTWWGSLEKNPCSANYHRSPKMDEFYTDGKRETRDVGYKYTEYAEGIFVGYRSEGRTAAPDYPFGFGLSYSQFEYSSLSLRHTRHGGVDVCFNVTNAGDVEAAEIAQVYVSELNPPVHRPVKELKGYSRQTLSPGETASFCIHLDQSAFSRYDMASHSWVSDRGEYVVSVATSADDIRLSETIRK